MRGRSIVNSEIWLDSLINESGYRSGKFVVKWLCIRYVVNVDVLVKWNEYCLI